MCARVIKPQKLGITLKGDSGSFGRGPIRLELTKRLPRWLVVFCFLDMGSSYRSILPYDIHQPITCFMCFSVSYCFRIKKFKWYQVPLLMRTDTTLTGFIYSQTQNDSKQPLVNVLTHCFIV